LGSIIKEGAQIEGVWKQGQMKIFGPKRDEVTGERRKLHNGEVHNLYSNPNFIRQIK
jgi:hypothetical protein